MAAIIQAPCKGCGRRELGCHVECPDYVAYQEENRRIKTEISKQRKRKAATDGFVKRQKELIREGKRSIK